MLARQLAYITYVRDSMSTLQILLFLYFYGFMPPTLSREEPRKIGYRLMNEAFSRLGEYDTISVWVLEKNERAICFYHKYGFEFDGCKKQWNLGTPVSIVRMIKKRE